MIKRINFIQDCINGLANPIDIDDYIDIWHESDSDKKIYEFLGMEFSEYSRFVKDDRCLLEIIGTYKNNLK